mmetsp:Transcript_17016/g.19002  ORF Transcript_17016/g.19002 Transcript_17016/m.19002 type:complete len:270 (+) Transcript_17016:30-839(+)|eukprot:CAMPEP_0205820674 /NCGR_PEP_ID=MMETSP0206-20130828/3342_1 /ASSEMBLY_ACC=CAM_ASM_000279 /TAXON_ID=36767 /ORGANISM="Euplotes focardii, Strain TN1" /LENGTH=269 /DNA_ID=CAMNT_0053115615 /DNA_START=23 /DNA_END=832 /DNA_ORIENTATION=-
MADESKQSGLLAGKLCLVTGATSGIGAATARVFVKEGAKVCATGRNQEALDALAAEIGCAVVAADLTKEGECSRVVKEAVDALGGLTTLVNSAGVIKGGAFGSEKCDLDNFLFNFRGNTQSVFEMMTHSIPHMKEAGAEVSPAIVNVSSVNGLVSFGGVGSYCTSKAAVDMMSKCAAVDLAPYGIRVNCVNPGVVITELQKRGGMGEEAYEAFLKKSIEQTHPLGQALGRVASPEEVGDLIAFLCSSKAAWITGDSVKIDGGRGCVGAR